MSLFDFDVSRQLHTEMVPFYALVMAAMRCADSTNQAKLRAAFPEVWAELDARYNAPGGRLPEDGPVPS